MKILNSFFDFNRRLALFIEKQLPHARPDITLFYKELVTSYIKKEQKQVIVDIGGGRETPYAYLEKKKYGYTIIAVDVSKEELEKNKRADRRIVADLNTSLPLPKESADIITSRYTIEHLSDTNAAVALMQKVLKKGGVAIHLFPTRVAPFAVLNRLLPDALAKKILYKFLPESKDFRGFKTYYNHCQYFDIQRVFEKNGFGVEKMYISYYQSRYFSFFLPFYLASVLYELILYALDEEDLSSYILIVAKKR